jgi:hypothetical protein
VFCWRQHRAAAGLTALDQRQPPDRLRDHRCKSTLSSGRPPLRPPGGPAGAGLGRGPNGVTRVPPGTAHGGGPFPAAGCVAAIGTIASRAPVTALAGKRAGHPVGDFWPAPKMQGFRARQPAQGLNCSSASARARRAHPALPPRGAAPGAGGAWRRGARAAGPMPTPGAVSVGTRASEAPATTKLADAAARCAARRAPAPCRPKRRAAPAPPSQRVTNAPRVARHAPAPPARTRPPFRPHPRLFTRARAPALPRPQRPRRRAAAGRLQGPRPRRRRRPRGPRRRPQLRQAGLPRLRARAPRRAADDRARRGAHVPHGCVPPRGRRDRGRRRGAADAVAQRLLPGQRGEAPRRGLGSRGPRALQAWSGAVWTAGSGGGGGQGAAGEPGEPSNPSAHMTRPHARPSTRRAAPTGACCSRWRPTPTTPSRRGTSRASWWTRPGCAAR